MLGDHMSDSGTHVNNLGNKSLKFHFIRPPSVNKQDKKILEFRVKLWKQ